MVLLDSRSPEVMGAVRTFVPESRESVGPEAVEAYKQDGVICLRSAMGEDWLSVVEDAIGLFLTEEAEVDDHHVIVQSDGDDGAFQYSSMMWKHNTLFRKVIFESHAPDLFGSILETRRLNFFYDFLLIKNPGCRSASTPWHQDISYLRASRYEDHQLLDRAPTTFRSRLPCVSSGVRIERARFSGRSTSIPTGPTTDRWRSAACHPTSTATARPTS